MENFAVLCPELAFKIEYYADAAAYQDSVGTECGQLCCCTGSREDGYVLAVNCEWLLEAWQHSALHGLLSSESFTDAFVVSELSVLRYEKTALFTGTEGYRHLERLKKDILYRCIYRSLFRTFCEYKLARELPEFGKLLTLLNMTTQDVELEQLVKYLPQRGQLEALQVFLKYGIIEPQGDSSFYDFMVPLALTAVRTELQNLIVVTDLLTEWLQGLRMTSEITPVWEQKAAAAGTAGSMSMLKVLSEEELCEIVRKEHIRELKAKMQNAASQTGKLAGVGRMVSRSGDTSQFFLDTVRKYRREIGELEYIFKQSFTSMKIIGAYDGDVNLKKQQEAYLASKTAEESRVYQYYLRRKVSVDIMIIRDVSGSTYRFEREYAEALIEILAAVNNFDGIRTLVIDFEGGAKVRKSFIDKAEQTSIVPLSGGGTNLLPAVRLLQEQVLKGKRRLLFLLSDGEINDREQAERELNDYCRRNQIEMVKITFDEEDKYGYEHTTIINLHRFLARRIIEKGAAY